MARLCVQLWFGVGGGVRLSNCDLLHEDGFLKILKFFFNPFYFFVETIFSFV